MSTETSTAVVNILDKDYQVTCPVEQQSDLLLAARHLDEQMRNIRATGKVVGLERIAVMAALNITHDLMQNKAKSSKVRPRDVDALKKLNNKLDGALQKYRQLEI